MKIDELRTEYLNKLFKEKVKMEGDVEQYYEKHIPIKRFILKK